jgi:hypothetical protein
VIELEEVDGPMTGIPKTGVSLIGEKLSVHAYDLIGTKESVLDQRKDIDIEVDSTGASQLESGKQHLGLHRLIQFSHHYLIIYFILKHRQRHIIHGHPLKE